MLFRQLFFYLPTNIIKSHDQCSHSFFLPFFHEAKWNEAFNPINQIQYRPNNTNLTGELRLHRHGPRIRRVGIFLHGNFNPMDFLTWGYGSLKKGSCILETLPIYIIHSIYKPCLTLFLVIQQHVWSEKYTKFK